MHRAWERQHFTHGKQNACLPIFNYLQAKRATRQRRPLLQLKTKQFRLPARRWKRSLQLGTCRWDAMEALHRRQTDTYLPIFYFLPVKRATRQRRPLLQLKTQRLMLPAHRWKCLLQLYKCKGHGNGSTLPTANKIPVCRSLIVYKQKARRGNVAFFYS